MSEKSVITIATGKPYYINMAVNLARSFLYWHPESEIQFWLVTDQPQLVPKEVANVIYIKAIDPDQYGSGFSTKLYLDQFVQTQYTLFIDADCLVYGNLTSVFDQFKGKSVSAIGDNIVEGNFFCDVKQVIQKLNVPYMPRFVGGVYYLEKGEVCKGVFDKARELLPSYDKLGLIRLRGKENEEPLVALGMAHLSQETIPEDGRIKADRMFYSYLTTNVLSGKAKLWNKEEFPKGAYFQISKSTPVIVHFNDSYSEEYEYLAETHRLYLCAKLPSKLLANLSAHLYHIMPGKFKGMVKGILRPLYHTFFGYRNIKVSKRIA